jgi:hypothetical protein
MPCQAGKSVAGGKERFRLGVVQPAPPLSPVAGSKERGSAHAGRWLNPGSCFMGALGKFVTRP